MFDFQTGGPTVSPHTYIHVLEIKSDIHGKNHSMLLAVHPWCWPAMVCLSIHTHMTWSDPHRVQCGCAGLMSHRCDIRHECMKGIEELRNGCEVLVMHFSPSLEKVTRDKNKFPSGVAEFNL